MDGLSPGLEAVVAALAATATPAALGSSLHDPEHGRRAAAAVRGLAEAGVLELAPERLRLLCRACSGHANGFTSADPTVGYAWDSDRLNLWRCGVAPSRRLLSTAAARSAEVFDWSYRIHAAGEG